LKSVGCFTVKKTDYWRDLQIHPRQKTNQGTSGSLMSQFKIAIVGGGGVGKSALTVRYVNDKFNDEYDPTIEDSYRKQDKISFNGKEEICFLEIIDTAGQEEYSALRDQFMRTGQGFVLVYSITDRKSLDELDEFKDQIMRVKDAEYVPMVYVGNKCDMEDQRVVTLAEGKSKAKHLNGDDITLFEASAKENINVKELFHELAREIKKDLDSNSKKEVDVKKKKKKCEIL
jgi:GTPase KRas protein